MKELSPIQASWVETTAVAVFAKNFVVLQFLGFGTTRITRIKTHRHEQTMTSLSAPSCGSLAAELRRGGFARFVVMLGGVKTKDVLTLT